MIHNLISSITDWIIYIISTLSYPGVALLMAIESAAIPLPSEIIMPFSGTLAAMGRFNLFGLALAGGIGSVVGSWITYAIGYFGGRPLIVRYGQYVLITPHDLDLSDRFFKKFGGWSTFLGRMLPVVRTFISIPAGISREPIVPFTLGAFVGSFIWSYFLAWLGLRLGEKWSSLEIYFRRFEILIAIIIVGTLIWWIRRHLKHRIQG